MKRLVMAAALIAVALAACDRAQDVASTPSTSVSDQNSTDQVSDKTADADNATYKTTGDDSVASDGSSDEGGNQVADNKAQIAEEAADHRWYVLNMNAHHCSPVIDTFGVATPFLVQMTFNQKGIPLQTIKNTGGDDDGAIVMLQSPVDASSGPMSFVKGKGSCIVAMKMIQAETGDQSPYQE